MRKQSNLELKIIGLSSVSLSTSCSWLTQKTEIIPSSGVRLEKRKSLDFSSLKSDNCSGQGGRNNLIYTAKTFLE